MKQWQEIEGGWTVEWLDGSGNLSGASEVASFPSGSGALQDPPMVGIWRAAIHIDKGFAAGSLLLRIAGTNGRARVLVNQQPVSDWLEPWLASFVNLGAFAQIDSTVHLAIEIQGPNPHEAAVVASGEGEALSIGPVLYELPRLISVAGPILSDVVVRSDFHTERVRVGLHFHNSEACSANLSVRLIAPDGTKGEFKREIKLSENNALHELDFEVPDCKPWSPEVPALYAFEFSIDGIQATRVPFGFSAPVWTEKGITLNDLPFFVRGVRWDAAGHAGFLANTAIKTELQHIREAGFNTIFPCSAPMPEPILVLAQQMGLMVIQNLGSGAMANTDEAQEASLKTATALVVRQECMANVLAFVGADLPGPLLIARESDWLKTLGQLRQEATPKGWRKDVSRTVLAHLGGTRLEIGHPPTQDPVQAFTPGLKTPVALEVHRFRLPAPVSIQRQSFLTRHLHPRDPSDLVEQGLGDSLFWKKLNKSRSANTRFFAARVGCPSILDPESTQEALADKKLAPKESLGRLTEELRQELTRLKLQDIWTPSAFATACQQVGAQAVLRQADALTVNPRCCGILVNQWSDTPLHSSGLVGLAGQPKPGFDLFRKYHKPTRVIAEATGRTPYTMGSAGIRIQMFNDGAHGEYALLLRVKGKNGRIWHQESLPAVSEGGLSNVGKFEFPVGDESGSFTFDMQLSRNTRDVCRTEEIFYVPPAVNLEAAAATFRYLGDFPDEVLRHGRSDARAVLVNQVKTFDPARLQELLDDAVTGLTVVFAAMDPDDVRFLNRHGGLEYALELTPAASAGGEGFHFITPSPLFNRLPAGIVAGEVYADLLPSWSMECLSHGELTAGFTQLQGASNQWVFRADIQTVPHGKGKIIFHQYRLWDRLGTSALADAMFTNLSELILA